eukprot:3933430-Rhodomonas_salina.11
MVKVMFGCAVDVSAAAVALVAVDIDDDDDDEKEADNLRLRDVVVTAGHGLRVTSLSTSRVAGEVSASESGSASEFELKRRPPDAQCSPASRASQSPRLWPGSLVLLGSECLPARLSCPPRPAVLHAFPTGRVEGRLRGARAAVGATWCQLLPPPSLHLGTHAQAPSAPVTPQPVWSE